MVDQSVSTPAVAYLLEAGVPFSQLTYEHSSEFDHGFGVEAAQKLGFDPAEVFKTLLVDADGEVVCVVVPVDHRMSLKKVARAAGAKKARMLPPEVAQHRTGYVVGGISPFGQKQQAPVIIDQSCLNQGSSDVSGGRRGFSLRMDVLDFVDAAKALVEDVVATS